MIGVQCVFVNTINKFCSYHTIVETHFSIFQMLISTIVPLWLFSAIATAEAKQPLNIVFIIADDLGFDDVSFRGGREFLTPNIDALAYHGKILDKYYTPTWDVAARATLLTGRYPIHNGLPTFEQSDNHVDGQWHLPLNVRTLPELLQEAGYATQLVGKWHLGYAQKEYTPTFRGFDYHYGFWNDHINYYSRRHDNVHANLTGYDFRRNLQVECTATGKYLTDLLTEEAERLIDQQKQTQKPFLLMVSHLAVNRGNYFQPLEVPSEELNKFRHIQDPARRKYAAMLTKLDESVGRIVSALDRAELLSETVVIFCADNSAPAIGKTANGGSNYPLRGQKNMSWEGGVRVPAAIWSPRMQQAHTIFRPVVYAGDWLPTLSAVANVDVNIQYDGINQWPQLSGVSNQSTVAPNEREIVHILSADAKLISYMRGQWKYVRGTVRNGTADGVLVLREYDDLHPKATEYVRIVGESLTAQTLSKYDDPARPLNASRISQLCRKAHVRCGQMQRGCNALIEDCLFDLQLDPCEQNNLAQSREHTDLLATMRTRVELHKRNIWQADQATADRAEIDPARHDCLWTNYEQEQPKEARIECQQSAGRPCETDV